MKYKYYVGIPNDDDCNKVCYVTEADFTNKLWFAKEGKEALVLTKGKAEDLVFGLMANGISAFVVQCPDCISLRNTAR